MSSELKMTLESLLDVSRPDLEKAYEALIKHFTSAEATGFFYACLGTDLAVSFGFWALKQRENGFVSELPDKDTGYYDLLTVVATIKTVLASNLDRNDLSSFVEDTKTGLQKILFYLAKLFCQNIKDTHGRPFYLAVANTLQYIDIQNNEIIEHAEILRRLGFDPSKAESAGPAILLSVPSNEELQPLNSLAEAREAFEKNPGYTILKRKYAEFIIASGQDQGHLSIRLLLSAWSDHDDKAAEILRTVFFKDSGQFETLAAYKVYLSHLIDLK